MSPMAYNQMPYENTAESASFNCFFNDNLNANYTVKLWST